MWAEWCHSPLSYTLLWVQYWCFSSSMAALESHEGEEQGKETVNNGPKHITGNSDDHGGDVIEKQHLAISLSQQNSSSTCNDQVNIHVAEAEVHGKPELQKRWVWPIVCGQDECRLPCCFCYPWFASLLHPPFLLSYNSNCLNVQCTQALKRSGNYFSPSLFDLGDQSCPSCTMCAMHRM